MLSKRITEGFGNQEGYNCAEKIVYGANEAYQLHLDKSALKLAAGFGGGMGIESTCGALTGSIMILSHLFVKDHAHESTLIKEISREFLTAYQSEMGDINCAPLKEKYRTPETQCSSVIAAAAKALEAVIERHQPQRVN